jgi:hypothetical protein
MSNYDIHTECIKVDHEPTWEHFISKIKCHICAKEQSEDYLEKEFDIQFKGVRMKIKPLWRSDFNRVGKEMWVEEKDIIICDECYAKFPKEMKNFWLTEVG